MKTCTKCGITRYYNEFYKNSRMKDGYYNECRQCWRLKNKKQYINNAEKYSERNASWYSNNKEKVLLAEKRRKEADPVKFATKQKEATARWREKNPDYVKKYYEMTAEHRRAYNHLYRKNNPDLMRAQYHRKRARKACAVPQRWIKSEETPGKCYWCGTNIHDYHEIDHIMPISLGGPAEDYNEVKTCKDCNGPSGKWDKHPLVWIAHQF